VSKIVTPRPGWIGLTQISGFTGKAIRFGQWLNGDGFSDYEHAFMPVGNGNIVEAMPGGATYGPNWHDPATTRWLICPEEFSDAVAHHAIEFVGTRYAFEDYAALAAHRFGFHAPHLQQFIDSSGSMICSQLVDAAARLGGWNLFADGRWSGDVTPGDLNRLWESLPAGKRA
jgi:hypothetical protein